MPLFAARDKPETTEMGTARISGHGVAATNTATVRSTSPVNI